MFQPFPKIGRLFKDCTITEKIDGTNAAVIITDEGRVMAQSRNRLITPEDDNFGFARWADDNSEELLGLGVGTHFGEWWGQGIQRGYGLTEKRFSLFNTIRWSDANAKGDRPACCHVVPVLYEGPFDTAQVDFIMDNMVRHGSYAAPGFSQPEGVMVFHHGAGIYLKAPFGLEAKGASRGA